MGVVSGNVKNCSSSLLGHSCILAPFTDVLISDHIERSLSQNALLLSDTLCLCVCVYIYLGIYLLLYFTELSVFLSFRL